MTLVSVLDLYPSARCCGNHSVEPQKDDRRESQLNGDIVKRGYYRVKTQKGLIWKHLKNLDVAVVFHYVRLSQYVRFKCLDKS